MSSNSNASDSETDVGAILAQIEDPKTRHAAEDLIADWEREGFILQSRIDQLALTRGLHANQLAEVMASLRHLHVRHSDEPDDAELAADELIELENSAIRSAESGDDPTRPLPHHEVVQLCRAIQLGRLALADTTTVFDKERQSIVKRAEAARDRMIVSNTRLVYTIAKDYAHIRIVPFEDLIQEGMIGLMKAVDRYDATRGCRFGTYAVWWIRQTILRAIANRGTTVRIPVHRASEVVRFRKAREILTNEADGEEPTLPELAIALNWDIDKVIAIEELSRTSYVSIDAPLSDDSEECFGDRLQSETLSPLEQCEAKERRVWVSQAINQLPRRHRDIVSRRFGLGSDGTSETLEEIGQDYQLTRERIRQIQREALKTMRPRAKRWIEKGLTD